MFNANQNYSLFQSDLLLKEEKQYKFEIISKKLLMKRQLIRRKSNVKEYSLHQKIQLLTKEVEFHCLKLLYLVKIIQYSILQLNQDLNSKQYLHTFQKNLKYYQKSLLQVFEIQLDSNYGQGFFETLIKENQQIIRQDDEILETAELLPKIKDILKNMISNIKSLIQS